MGLAQVNIVSFSTNIKLLITNWTLLEKSIIAISRVRTFEVDAESEADTESENQVLDNHGHDLAHDWPKGGEIHINNISAKLKYIWRVLFLSTMPRCLLRLLTDPL